MANVFLFKRLRRYAKPNSRISNFHIESRRFFTGIVRDITHRKQLEEQLRGRLEELAEADHRKNEFLATLAHELRNPLAPIRNGLHILRRIANEEPSTSSTHEILERQVKHMVRLVDDLLEVSRISSGKISLRTQPVDISEVLCSALETSKPLIEANRHQLQVSFPEKPLIVSGDPVRLSQIVANLLNNAAKYTEPGGTILLSVSQQNGELSISVRDTGIGISPAMLLQIFRMFAQADKDHKRAQGGLGIGLALAKTLVEMHGGRIEAQSAGEGRGSEFIVHLPLAKPTTVAEPPTPSVNGIASEELEKRSPAGRRVLVVDDNQDAASSLAMVLNMLGHEVQTANDGLEALNAFQSFAPAVVFLDLGMPGMSGYEVAERLRAMPGGSEAVLVALTGWGQEEDRRRTSEAGFDYHLVKPVEIESLEKVLSDLPAFGRT